MELLIAQNFWVPHWLVWEHGCKKVDLKAFSGNMASK